MDTNTYGTSKKIQITREKKIRCLLGCLESPCAHLVPLVFVLIPHMQGGVQANKYGEEGGVVRWWLVHQTFVVKTVQIAIAHATALSHDGSYGAHASFK